MMQKIKVYKDGVFFTEIYDKEHITLVDLPSELHRYTLDQADLALWDKDVIINDIKNECERRLIVFINARDAKHLSVIISNGSRRSIALSDKRVDHLEDPVNNSALTVEENAEAQYLRSVNVAIDAIREASNELESMNPVPDNFTDDAWWP